MLFSVFMKPLGEVIRIFWLQGHQYMDDIQLYLSIPTDPKVVVERNIAPMSGGDKGMVVNNSTET